MARYKTELKRIHRKKVRRAKARVRLHCKGELPYEKLGALAKRFLATRKRREKKSA